MKKIYFTAMSLLGWAAGSYGQGRELEDDMNIYPDPATRTLKVVYTSSEKIPLQIKVVNPTGITVYSESMNEGIGEHVKIIDLGMQSRGTYTVRAENEKFKQVELVKFD